MSFLVISQLLQVNCYICQSIVKFANAAISRCRIGLNHKKTGCDICRLCYFRLLLFCCFRYVGRQTIFLCPDISGPNRSFGR